MKWLTMALLWLLFSGCGMEVYDPLPESDGGQINTAGQEGGLCWQGWECIEDRLQCLSGYCVALPSCDDDISEDPIFIENVPWLPQVPVNEPGTNGGCSSCRPEQQPENCWQGCPGTCKASSYCGPTAAAMLSGWASNSAPNPDSLYSVGLWASQNLSGGWNLNCGSGSLTSTEKIKIILRDYFGMTPKEPILNATLCDINNALKRGHPVIVTTLSQRGVMGPEMKVSGSAHAMVVVGISKESIWVNDSGRSDELNGKGKQYSLSSFRHIWYSIFPPEWRVVFEATGSM